MKFTLEKYHRNIPDEDLLNDLRRVSESVMENLQTLCEQCNIGKSDLPLNN